MKINKGILFILISAFGYALMPILSIPALNNGTQVSTLLFVRFTVATTVIWLFIRYKKYDYKISRSHFFHIVLITTLGFTMASICVYNAYKYISGSIVTMILFIHPIFIIAFERLFQKKLLNSKKVFGAVLTFIGLIVLLFVKEKLSSLGLALSFMSAFAYTFYCIGLHEERTRKLNGIVTIGYVTTIMSVTFGIMCLVKNQPLIEFNTGFLFSSLMLAFFSTIIASICFCEGIKRIGPSTATIIGSIEPMYVIVLSAMFLDEPLKINTLLGAIMIIFGIVLAQSKTQTFNKINYIKRDA